MVEKLHEYEGFLGRLHTLREKSREKWSSWRQGTPGQDGEGYEGSGGTFPLNLLQRKPPKQVSTPPAVPPELADYSHVYREQSFNENHIATSFKTFDYRFSLVFTFNVLLTRKPIVKPSLLMFISICKKRKTRAELVRISAAVMGIEFSYAAETAFVSPILLKIGVHHEHMTLVWCLSPLVGFFVTPILGSLSDRCNLPWGRRRPFILALALGIFLGLLLVPNGELLGYALGDYYPSRDRSLYNLTANLNSTKTVVDGHQPGGRLSAESGSKLVSDADYPHPWSVFFTILGTVLLDFDADACQSPSRAYLLDVTQPEDHARGLSTFTIMAGLGGFLGYALGAINWDITYLGVLLGGHVRAVFTLITFIFIICVSYTITSFREIPLSVLERDQEHQTWSADESAKIMPGVDSAGYGTLTDPNCQAQVNGEAASNGYVNYGYDESYAHQQQMQYQQQAETSFGQQVTKVEPTPSEPREIPTLRQYLLSIVYMPQSMRILCLTNFFCWSAHVCYSLYFTDFVGEAVFGGDPTAAEGTVTKELYEEGVRFGCWGMSMYSLSCAVYSLIIEKLIKRFKARNVYVCGLLMDSLGMLMLAITRHPFSVIVFSAAAGIMYSTLFTMPYLLVAHYHASGTFEVTADGEAKMGTQLRGLGTDVGIVSSMVFLAQFTLSMCMGSIVHLFGTTTTVVSVAAILCACGAVAATRVMYLDL